jgi:hypothetical protein
VVVVLGFAGKSFLSSCKTGNLRGENTVPTGPDIEIPGTSTEGWIPVTAANNDK